MNLSYVIGQQLLHFQIMQLGYMGKKCLMH